jgi:exodeoxyribonuclease III
MKIVSWNCSNSLAAKGRMEQLLSINADIAVVPECEQQDMKILDEQGLSSLWIGVGKGKKGLGVFAQKGWELAAFENDYEFRGVLPIKVSGPCHFTLLAVWSVGAYGGYAEQIYNAITEHSAWFTGGPVVVAGDFNTTSSGNQPARKPKHSDLVDILRANGLESAYHAVANEAHGQESRHTYHHQWKAEQPFHIDYIFVPKAWLRNISEFSVGPHAFWSKYSDHRPLGVSLTGVPARG